jgi:hypothetical protein
MVRRKRPKTIRPIFFHLHAHNVQSYVLHPWIRCRSENRCPHMIPQYALFIFFFTGGLAVGWITTHIIIGYKYEKLILTEYKKNKGGAWPWLVLISSPRPYHLLLFPHHPCPHQITNWNGIVRGGGLWARRIPLFSMGSFLHWQSRYAPLLINTIWETQG